MTAKEFLRQVRHIDRQIDEHNERVERLRAKLEAGRMSSLTGMPRGGFHDWTATADALMRLEDKLGGKVDQMTRLKTLAVDAINAVEDARLRELLELYYLDGKTWEQVAEKMELDVRWVYRLHGRALMRVRVPEEYEGR